MMNQHIRNFSQVNESMKQHGIILIKGKPSGKGREQKLFATHVNSWAEIRPGAVMLFLSDIFYRIIQDGDKLKGVKINWKDEDSLKNVLNFKSPGKLSVVRNNNKTPYHWKTLNQTSLRAALDAVEKDLIKSDYVFESSMSFDEIDEIVAKDTIDALFRDGKNVVILDWTIPEDDYFEQSIESDERRGSESLEWEASFDCLYVGRPELDQDLDEMGIRRFEAILYFNSEVSFTQWYDPGDRDTPPDGDIEIVDVDTEFFNMSIDGHEITHEVGLSDSSLYSSPAELLDVIEKKHVKFI